MEDLAVQLFEKNAVNFGKFRLKSGVDSPVYVDLRVTVSHPELLKSIGKVLYKTMTDKIKDTKLICGVPYAALPFATCLSTYHDIPMIMRRKEVKAHGTKRAVEGEYVKGEECVIVEDVVSTGGSILETAEVLRAQGLVVNCAIVLLDRQQGGYKNLQGQGIQLYSAMSILELLDILENREKISSELATSVREYINTTKPQIRIPGRLLTYEQRAQSTSNPIGSKLLKIMSTKQTNLAFSADVGTSSELLKVANEAGPHICILKTHVDILSDFTEEVARELSVLANKHNFIIMEDRKFADIGNTCKLQFNNPRYHLNNGWAQLITAHAIPGPGTLTALKEAAPKDMGCVLVVEMSSKGNLAVADYVESAVQMAEANSDFVVGMVCQRKLSDKMIHMSPGVNITQKDDPCGQNYNTPDQVIRKQLSDIIIVGRGIYKSENPREKAREYQKAAYAVYNQSLADQGRVNS